MLPADDRVRLRHMVDAARKAQEWVAGRDRDDLEDDEKLSLALQRLIEIIGEAAKKVTAATRSQGDSIPWQEIAGMRDRLIHAYFDVNLDLLWNTVTEDMPSLIDALEELLSKDASS